MPEISVIIPVYNVERYIARCLDSVLSQKGVDMEVICVDDGSPDSSGTIADEYASKDSRVKVIHQPNRGPGGARNTGMDIATGEYLSFIDPDDYVSENYYAEMYRAAVKYNADMVTASMIMIHYRKNKPNTCYINNTEERLFTEISDRCKCCMAPPDFHSTNKIFRREVVGDLRFPSHSICEDVVFMAHLLVAAQSVVTVPTATYWYMENSKSITRSHQTFKKQDDKYRSFKEMLQIFDAAGVQFPDSCRRLRKRTYALGCITFLKIKEYRDVETWRVFDFIPVYRRKAKPLEIEM